MGIFSKRKKENEIKKNVVVTTSNSDFNLTELMNILGDPINISDLIKTPFLQSCIGKISKKATDIPLKFYSGKKEIINDFTLKFDFPNMNYNSKKDLVEHILLLLLIKGKVFIYDRANYLDIMGTDRVTINIKESTKIISSYTIDGTRVSSEKVIYIRLNNNPDNIINPYAPTEILENELKTHIESGSFIKDFIQQRGFSYFAARESLDSGKINLYEKFLKDAIAKVKKGKTPYIPANFEHKQLISNIKGMAFDYFLERADEVIANYYNIPNFLINKLKSGGSYALSKQEKEEFYNSTLDHYLSLLEYAFTQHIKLNYDPLAYCQRDISNIPYLQNKNDLPAAELISLYSSDIISKNEVRERLGFSIAKSIEIPKSKNIIQDPPVKNEQIEKELTELRDKNWEKQIHYFQPLENDLKKELKNLFDDFGKMLLDDYKDQNKEKSVEKKNFFDFTNQTEDIFRNKLKKILDKFYDKGFKRADKHFDELYEFGISYELPSDWVKDYIDNELKIVVKEISQTTKNKLKELLSSSTDSGGIPLNEFQNLIQDLTEFNKNRCKTIARTESNKVLNNHHEKKADLINDDMPLEKAWSSAKDSEVRQTHIEQDARGWIDYDDKFILNGIEAKGPYDENLPADEKINCRCTLLYRVKKV